MTGCPGKVESLAFHRTSRCLANGGTQEISVWDFSGKGPMGKEPRMLPAHEKQVSAHAWQPTGDLLVSAGRDGGLALWAPGAEAHGAQPPLRLDVGARVTTLAWSPDGTGVVAATVDGTVAAVAA